MNVRRDLNIAVAELGIEVYNRKEGEVEKVLRKPFRKKFVSALDHH